MHGLLLAGLDGHDEAAEVMENNGVCVPLTRAIDERAFESTLGTLAARGDTLSDGQLMTRIRLQRVTVRPEFINAVERTALPARAFTDRTARRRATLLLALRMKAHSHLEARCALGLPC